MDRTEISRRPLIVAGIALLATLATAGAPVAAQEGSAVLLELLSGESFLSPLGLEDALCTPLVGPCPGCGEGPKLDVIVINEGSNGGGSDGRVHGLDGALSETGGWAVFRLVGGVMPELAEAFQAELEAVRLCTGGRLQTRCGRWRYRVALAGEGNATDRSGSLDLHVDTDRSGGTFRGEMELPLSLSFEHEQEPAAVEVTHRLPVRLRGWWSRQPGADALIATAPFPVDTDCDGSGDLWLPATAEVHLGWRSAEDGPRPETLCGAGELAAGWLCWEPARDGEP